MVPICAIGSACCYISEHMGGQLPLALLILVLQVVLRVVQYNCMQCNACRRQGCLHWKAAGWNADTQMIVVYLVLPMCSCQLNRNAVSKDLQCRVLFGSIVCCSRQGTVVSLARLLIGWYRSQVVFAVHSNTVVS